MGERLRATRKKRRLSQEALGARAGLSYKAVGELERGEVSDPHISTIENLADALGVSVFDLYVPHPKAQAPARIPTLAELRGVTSELERLIAWARGHIEHWQSEGVNALEDAVVTSYILDRACEQVAADLVEVDPVDEIFNRREEMADKIVAAANERVQAHRRLLGVSAEARRAAWELSQQADTEAAKGLDKLESLTRTHDEQYA